MSDIHKLRFTALGVQTTLVSKYRFVALTAEPSPKLFKLRLSVLTYPHVDAPLSNWSYWNGTAEIQLPGVSYWNGVNEISGDLRPQGY